MPVLRRRGRRRRPRSCAAGWGWRCGGRAPCGAAPRCWRRCWRCRRPPRWASRRAMAPSRTAAVSMFGTWCTYCQYHIRRPNGISWHDNCSWCMSGIICWASSVGHADDTVHQTMHACNLFRRESHSMQVIALAVAQQQEQQLPPAAGQQTAAQTPPLQAGWRVCQSSKRQRGPLASTRRTASSRC